MRVIVFLVAAVLGFLAAFSFTARDEIGAEVATRLDRDFVDQCVARAGFPEELRARAPAICTCMKAEFDTRGLKLTDAFGSAREEMQDVTQACVGMYR